MGNDINAVPSAAIERVEILRDGAAAQYGSDAIAGVINFQLKNNRSGGSIRTYSGISLSKPKYDGRGSNANLEGDYIYGSQPITDGETFSTSINFGLPWGEDGFINSTLYFHHNEAYDRSGTFTDTTGWYSSDPVEEARLLDINNINLDRAVLGAAQNTNGGIFINSGKPLSTYWDYYFFGGFSLKACSSWCFFSCSYKHR